MRPPLKTVCALCGAPDATRRCSHCRAFDAYYCSAECQRKHWDDHKVMCRPAVGSARAAKPGVAV